MYSPSLSPPLRLLPDGGGGYAVQLAVQRHLVLLQLADDLADASDHTVYPAGQALAGFGLLHGTFLARLGQLFTDLHQVLRWTERKTKGLQMKCARIIIVLGTLATLYLNSHVNRTLHLNSEFWQQRAISRATLNSRRTEREKREETENVFPTSSSF